MQNIEILIVGAGVAGLTCAGLQAKQGIDPVIVEKENEQTFNSSGYMLGILPLGGRVLNALDARDEYFGNSIQMENYEVHQSNGKLLKNYLLDFINQRYGSYRGIARTDLIDILREGVRDENITFNTTVSNLTNVSDGVEVTFSDGQTAFFNVVVIADGLHSQTRSLIMNKSQYSYRHTGWGGWVSWLDEAPNSSYKEYWGSGSFLGLYPVKNKIGVFLGGPVEKLKKEGLDSFKAETDDAISNRYDLPHRALEAFDNVEEPFFWQFQDCRTQSWVNGKVVLLGDAATGFLPTAGVGASMAMDSAAVLADELSRADRKHIEYALKLYEQRQKEHVEKAQQDSRKLGKVMFVQSPIISKIRNKLMPFYSLKQLLGDLSDVMEGT